MSNAEHAVEFSEVPASYRRFCEIVGEGNYSTDPIDLDVYSRDLAPIPEELLHGYGALPPQLILRPRHVDHVKEILRASNEMEIPVTPRGGGSFAMGGTIPIEGGIVLDLNSMDEILEINETDRFVRVQGGVIWKKLLDKLANHGLTVLANPSSGVSATVGGYLGTGGGAGIGVPRWGVVGESVLSLKVVLPDGSLIETDPWESWAFIGAEGTLGVIVEATLKVGVLHPMQFHMYRFDSLSAGVKALEKIAGLKPYYLHFFDRGGIDMLIDSGAELEPSELTLIAGFMEPEARQKRLAKEVEEICNAGVAIDDGVARHEWNERYKVEINFKRLGPTLMVQEIRLPMRNLEDCFRDLSSALEAYRWGVQCLSSDHDSVCLLILALTDERDKKRFYQAMALAREIPRIGYRHDGTIYGLGLHNAAHISRIHSRTAIDCMRQIKQQVDPNNIMNPSKTVQTRVPGRLVDVSMLMMQRAPGLMKLGLSMAQQMPSELIRSGLKMAGGKLR